VRPREADTLLRFVRVARPAASTAVTMTTTADDDRHAQADRIVRHWRNELVPLAALPGVGGRFTQPIREVLAGTVQGLLVLSLARLCGVRDEREQVRLVATLVLREDLPADWVPRASDPEHEPADTDGPDTAAAAADVGVDADVAGEAPEETVTWRLVAGQVPVAIYRAARELWTVYSLSGQRAEGRLWHRALGNLPAVGVVGATLGERHALADIAAAAYVELGLAAVEAPGPTIAARAATAAKSAAAALPSFRHAARNPFRKP
jgi:hypothetical protein